MKKITTIKELIYELASSKNKHNKVLEIMKRVEFPREELERYYSWNDDRYARNVLAKTDDFEVLLVCWEEGQSSPVHDFNSQEAWIHPVQGWIKEERFKINPDDVRLEKVSSVLLGTSEYSYMNHVDIHRYSNANKGRSVSLNVYSKPVSEWRVYEEESSNSTVKQTWENKNFNLLDEKIAG